MYLLDVSIRDLKYFCVLFVLFVFLFMLLALLRCYTSIFDGFIRFLTIYKLEDVLNETESAFFNVMIQHNKTIKDGDCSIAMKLTA